MYCTRAHSGKQFQKFQQLYEGPFTVVENIRNNNYVIRNDKSGKLTTVHANRLKLSPFPEQLYAFTTNISQPENQLELEADNLESSPDTIDCEDIDPAVSTSPPLSPPLPTATPPGSPSTPAAAWHTPPTVPPPSPTRTRSQGPVDDVSLPPVPLERKRKK